MSFRNDCQFTTSQQQTKKKNEKNSRILKRKKYRILKTNSENGYCTTISVIPVWSFQNPVVFTFSESGLFFFKSDNSKIFVYEYAPATTVQTRIFLYGLGLGFDLGFGSVTQTEPKRLLRSVQTEPISGVNRRRFFSFFFSPKRQSAPQVLGEEHP
jgi:hypothetical protein